MLFRSNQFQFTEENLRGLSATSDVRANELLHLSPHELSDATGSVMVKDETICIRCGLCADRCPAGTITMEAFEVFERDSGLVQIEEVRSTT